MECCTPTPDIDPGVIGVATSGIQNVAALLPLLGTTQCGTLVTSALERGMLYAAAAPMSIFGSLGIAKAGFVTLFANIDTQFFPGPTLMRNAGFTPTGLGALLVPVSEGDGRRLYVAEDKLRGILGNKKIRNVRVNWWSKDFLVWNASLVLCSTALSSFGLLPYIFLLVRFLPGEPFHKTWIYPIMRIAGCNIVAIAIQFVYQLRIIETVYCRVRVNATDICLDERPEESLPDSWNHSSRSKDELVRLRHWVQDTLREGNCAGQPLKKAAESATLGLKLQDATAQLLGTKLGKIASFSFPPFGNVREPETSPDANAAELGTHVPKPGLPPYLRVVLGWIRWVVPNTALTTVLFWAVQFQLFVGVILIIVGYIGCFSVVQASPKGDSRGPLVWLVCEALLAVVRTLLWAWNPGFDDPKPPILLEKLPRRHLPPDGTTTGGEKGPPFGSSKDVITGGGDEAAADTTDRAARRTMASIGWTLSANATTEDMHALVVGIDEFNGSDDLHDLTGCVRDARRVKTYLEDTLMVPRSQIVTLTNGEATKERILSELKSLAQSNSVAQDAPILLYFATHSVVIGEDLYLVPYCGYETKGLKSRGLSHAYISQILHEVSRNKTNNITLIMDTCYNDESPNDTTGKQGAAVSFRGKLTMPVAGGGGSHVWRTVKSVDTTGYTSHGLIMGTMPGSRAQERANEGGIFTTHFLEVLQEPGFLQTKTYQGMIDCINEKLAKHEPRQQAFCSATHQNRLLFNGVLSTMAEVHNYRPLLRVQYSDPDDPEPDRKPIIATKQVQEYRPGRAVRPTRPRK